MNFIKFCRQKHRHLREQYKQHAGKVHVHPEQKDACARAVQTPEWNGDEPDNRLDFSYLMFDIHTAFNLQLYVFLLH